MRKLVYGLLLVAPIAYGQAELTGWAAINGTSSTGGSAPIVGPSSSHGVLNLYATRGDFNTAVPSQSCEDFEDSNISDGAITGFPGPLNAATDNALFAAGSIVAGLELRDNPLNDAGGGSADGLVAIGATAFSTPSDIVLANTFVDSLDLVFSPAVSDVAMDVFSFTVGGTATIEYYDASDNLLGSTTVGASPTTGGFVGASSPTPIARINIFSQDGSSADEAEGADNICFGAAAGPAPIPTVDAKNLFILALALMLIGFIVTKRRRA